MDELALGKACDRRAERLVDEWFKSNVHAGEVTLYGMGQLKQEIARELRRMMTPLVGIYDVATLALAERKQE